MTPEPGKAWFAAVVGWVRAARGGLSTDLLNPILVKELRQGLRSHLFTGSFMVLQLLLLLFGVSILLSSDFRSNSDAGAAIYWTLVSIPLLLLIPASAAQAIERERSGRTLELLLVTRLSAYRIVTGKWLSVVVQTALILVTTLPYVILRYFLGGIDLWGELTAVAVMFATSALLSGIATGFWSIGVSRWLKWGFIFILFWILKDILAVFMFGHRGGFSGVSGRTALFIAFVFGLQLLLLMLQIGASRIAPPAENHSSRIRLIAFAGVGATFLFYGASEGIQGMTTMCALLIALPVAVGSLNERVEAIPSLYAPFAQPGYLGQLVRLPFCPGWPGGVAFATVVLVLVPLMPLFVAEAALTKAPFAWLALVGACFVPFLVMRVLFPRAVKVARYYFAILLISAIPLYLWAFGEGSGEAEVVEVARFLAGFFPLSAFVLELNGANGGIGVVPRAILGVVAVVAVLGSWRLAIREWRTLLRIGRRRAPSRGRSPARAPSLDVPAVATSEER